MQATVPPRCEPTSSTEKKVAVFSTQSVPRFYKQDKLVSELVKLLAGVLVTEQEFSCCE
jgi:hypothetical protein